MFSRRFVLFLICLSVEIVVKASCISEDLIRTLLATRKSCKPGYNENVAFHAYVARHTPFSGNDILKFDNVDTNIGNNYDPTTGKFTAPKAGLYQIVCTIQGLGTSAVTFQIQKNNDLFDRGYAGGRDWHAVTRVLLMQLKEGDKVFVQHRDPKRKETVAGGRHSYFSGRFLQ
ncbi:C1QL [Mytilus coruscus]|uniref:C1QL n=1 Tax=Mytilus coruscus TaxID=42192 RepID=A0A6J8EEF4_MYTCO|nr:C1QL [Mytilus coruscus]